MDPSLPKTVLTGIALIALVEKAGGSVTVSEEEYNAIVAKYGGTARMNLRLEVVQVAGHAKGVRVTLEEKAPANAELVS